MWRDIFSMNRAEVVNAIREYEKSLAGMREAIERGDWAGLTARLERARMAKIDMERANAERKTPDTAFSLPDRLVIAIDGPAGSGKSTMAGLLAEKLDAVKIDTGAMYRSVTALMLDAGLDPSDQKAAEQTAKAMDVAFRRDGGTQKVIVNGTDLTARIRKPDVDASVSIVSAHPSVRQRLVEIQRKMGAEGRVVMEGRDIGSHVFPDADVKFYLTARDDTRAKRRNKDLAAQGTSALHEDTLEGIRSRDRIDSSRSASPLAKAEGAVEMDTSDLTIDEALGKMLKITFLKINRRSGGPVRSLDRKD
jgi:cytidylate kinase